MIETRDLAFQYPNGPRLTFPDIAAAQGDVLLLHGNSGSGKSTWLALVAALLSAARGRITVAGQDLTDLKGASRDAWRARALGFLPQKLHLSDALTVYDNLAVAYFAVGLPKDTTAIRTVLASLGLTDLAQRIPAQLSGGQAQRVAWARAVLLKPQVILADEPTVSLDDEAASAALTLLLETAKRCGATLAIATHDARARAALPDAVLLNLLNKTADFGKIGGCL